MSVPEDLAPRLIRLHGDPFVWWVGQILKYLLRPQDKTAKMLQDSMTKMGYKRPVVGWVFGKFSFNPVGFNTLKHRELNFVKWFGFILN